MIKYVVAATLIGGFWFFSMVGVAMMGGGPGAMLKRSFWNFAGSFIAIEVLAGLLLFFWFYKKDFFLLPLSLSLV